MAGNRHTPGNQGIPRKKKTSGSTAGSSPVITHHETQAATANPKSPIKMSEEARRSNFITWGVGLLTLAVAAAIPYFGGPWIAAVIVLVGGLGVILLLRGHFPQCFRGDFWTPIRLITALTFAVVAIGLWECFKLYGPIAPLSISVMSPAVPVEGLRPLRGAIPQKKEDLDNAIRKSEVEHIKLVTDTADLCSAIEGLVAQRASSDSGPKAAQKKWLEYDSILAKSLRSRFTAYGLRDKLVDKYTLHPELIDGAWRPICVAFNRMLTSIRASSGTRLPLISITDMDDVDIDGNVISEPIGSIRIKGFKGQRGKVKILNNRIGDTR